MNPIPDKEIVIVVLILSEFGKITLHLKDDFVLIAIINAHVASEFLSHSKKSGCDTGIITASILVIVSCMAMHYKSLKQHTYIESIKATQNNENDKLLIRNRPSTTNLNV